MSFWKTVGDLALKARKASVEMAKDAKDRNDNYKLEYSSYSDDKLFNEYAKSLKSGSLIKATAIGNILKERGHTSQDLNDFVYWSNQK